MRKAQEKTVLFPFLYHNLKGYRLLVALAIIVTISQVACDILAAFPLKFIPSKINNPGSDPACTFSFLNPLLDRFDIPQIDPSLRDPITHQVIPPPTSQCPVSSTDLVAAAHPVVTHHSVAGVIVFSVVMLIIFGMLSAALVYLDLFLAAYIAKNLAARLRNQLFEHLQRLSLDWHGKQKKGDLVQRVTGNIADIEKLVTDGLVDLLAGILTLLGVTGIMMFISLPYTLLSLAVAPTLFLIVLGYTRGIKAASRIAAKAAGQVADVATEDINALTVIKVFTREEREALRFGSFVDKNRQAGLHASRLQAQFTPLVSIMVMLGTAVVVGVGGFVAAGTTLNIGPFSIGAESVDIGTLVMFLTFLKLLYQPMRDLSKLTTLASAASSGAERIQEVLDQAPEVVESLIPYDGPEKLKGEITFENVVFGYSSDQQVLHGMDLHILAGRKVALVGTSGSGKTTLVKLIPRFYEVTSGAVCIDGLDNRKYPLTVLRNNISMVLQDSVLFEGTLFDNIALGKSGATLEEVVDAAKKADIHGEIVAVLGGYDRLVREQGKDLSGGQRQRIAIARAILRDAPILILDEPTASLDVEAEIEVMHTLSKLMAGRTVLTISHRLSTLGNVDEVIVLKDGHIVERGNFHSLQRTGGVFAELLADQKRYSGDQLEEQTAHRPAVVLAHRHHEQQEKGSLPLLKLAVDSVHSTGKLYESVQLLQGEERPAAYVLIELDRRVIDRRQLDKPVITVGRRVGNDIQIHNQRVSRLHARIREENGAWVIEDAESVNGIVFQGRRIDRLILQDGDKISIAPGTVLHYHIGE
jgi:ABC-type multidrug transport system fused ATPase/permease subunit